MSVNLPDDWSTFYRTCAKCGARFHASEGACFKCATNTEDSIRLKELLNTILNPERND